MKNLRSTASHFVATIICLLIAAACSAINMVMVHPIERLAVGIIGAIHCALAAVTCCLCLYRTEKLYEELTEGETDNE